MAYLVVNQLITVGCFTRKRLARQRIINEAKRLQEWCDSPNGDYLIDEQNRRCKVWLEYNNGDRDSIIIRYGRKENGWGTEHRHYCIMKVDLDKIGVDW